MSPSRSLELVGTLIMSLKSDEIPVRVQEQMAIEMAATATEPILTIAAAMVRAVPSTVIHQ